ncbi:MAG: ABC transporter ATP-binding protein [Defluviitaleaceae bacterium]|nr:ABC transporter ATP-binding protein [Defluviitaleaceae bacterium]
MSDMSELTEAQATERVAVQCENLVKIYRKRDIEVLALQGLDLTIGRGEVMAIIGNSGSGKSTLLNMIGGLDRPSAGKLYVCGKNLFKLNERELVNYKLSTVGFVWQNNARNLFPYLTAAENVMVPMQFLNGGKNRNKRRKAQELLELVGIGKKADGRLSELSGGEAQRVAIAIAIANSPELLLADEPTGSVDANTSAYLLDVFREINRAYGTTVVIVTHDRQIAKKVNRVVLIRDGKTSSEMIAAHINLDSYGFAHGEEQPAPAEQEEFTVLDRAGRMQIPPEYLSQLKLGGNRVKLRFEDGNLIVSPPDSGKEEPDGGKEENAGKESEN